MSDNMEKLSIAEVVERFGDSECVRYFKKYNHINDTGIKFIVINRMLEHYEEVERVGYGPEFYYILRKKRLTPIGNYEVSFELIYGLARTRPRNYPKEFYSKDTGSVYLATNKHTGEIYVGSTKRSLSIRISEHKSYVSNPNSLNYKTKIATAIREYGFDSFEWEILESIDNKKLIREAEDKWIDNLNSINQGYNENKSYRKKMNHQNNKKDSI